MLASAAPFIAPKPPAQPPATPTSAPAAGPSFAQLMTVRAALPVQPEATPAAEPAPAPQAAAPRRPTQPAKPAQQRPAEGAPKAEAKAPADKTDAETATDAVTAGADEDDATDTPQLKEFTQLLGMAAAQPEAARPDLHRAHGAAAAAADDAAQGSPGRPGLRGVAADTDRATAQPADARHAKAADLHADTAQADTRGETHALQTASAAASTASEPPLVAAPPATPGFAAVLAQALPLAAADAAPTLTHAGVHAPVKSDAFAPELGARVSLLAVDGVQQAQLQLNPADMGPVTVQITVDGSQAQVSFHAAQAETRQALEQSLPDLAAALQGQGLTLAGGGVFQQASHDASHEGERDGDGGTARDSRGGGDRVGAAATPGAPPARRSVGLLDTFA